MYRRLDEPNKGCWGWYGRGGERRLDEPNKGFWGSMVGEEKGGWTNPTRDTGVVRWGRRKEAGRTQQDWGSTVGEESCCVVGELTSTELAHDSLHAIQILLLLLVIQIVELSFVAEPPSVN